MIKIANPSIDRIQLLAERAKTPTRNFVRSVARDGYLPVIALEAFVEGGRTLQAYNRGGFDEARERITEEFSGAVFWLGGMPALNWITNKIGKKALKLPQDNFSTASDNVRNPLQNYIRKMVTDGHKINEKAIARFKFAQVVANVLIINSFIGFVVPKINQAITRNYHKKDAENKDVNAHPVEKNQQILKGNKTKEKNNNSKAPTLNTTMEDFLNTQNKNKNVPFGMNLLTIANKFETDRNYKLLSVDAGTASGRAYNARNNDERCEILFRDLGSIYFYMFNMPNINKWMNKLEQKHGTRLEPVSEKFTTNYIQEFLKENNNKINVKDFEKIIFGDENLKLPQAVTDKVKNGVITLNDFESAMKSTLSGDEFKNIKEIAERMSKLQPTLDNIAILTEKQAKDVLKGGAINRPEFLEELYKLSHSDFQDAFSFVPSKNLEAIKDDAEFYVKQIVEKAKKSNVTEITTELLEKASKQNKRMNALNYGLGFTISALFLSTIIPKMQYMITKLRTGSDKFPGTKDLDNK